MRNLYREPLKARPTPLRPARQVCGHEWLIDFFSRRPVNSEGHDINRAKILWILLQAKVQCTVSSSQGTRRSTTVFTATVSFFVTTNVNLCLKRILQKMTLTVWARQKNKQTNKKRRFPEESPFDPGSPPREPQCHVLESPEREPQ